MSKHCDIEHALSFHHDKEIKMDFDGGHISSYAGLIALRQFDHQIGFTEQIVARLHDNRNPMRVIHTLMVLVVQRLYALIAGSRDRPFRVLVKVEADGDLTNRRFAVTNRPGRSSSRASMTCSPRVRSEVCSLPNRHNNG